MGSRSTAAGSPRAFESRLRVSCALLAAATAVLAFYVSLVPFRFEMPDGSLSLVDVLWHRAEVGVISRGNGLANVVMFLPFGFFGLAAFGGDRLRWFRLAAAGALLATSSVVVSVSVEALQAFVPGRTPSLTDIVAQTVGTVFGAGGWLALGRHVRVWAARAADAHPSVVSLGLGIYGLVYAIYGVLPLDLTVDLGTLAERFRNGRIVIAPWQSSNLAWEWVPAMLSEFVLAAPVGALALVAVRSAGAGRVAGPALLLAAAAVAGLETVQVFVMSRTADVVDFVVNATGAAAGVLIALRLSGESARRSGVGPALGLAGLAVLYIAYNWSPFDFVATREFVAGRVGRLLAVPFAGYYQNPEFKALSDLTVKLAMSAPFGLALHLLLARGARVGRTTTIVVLVCAAVFFAIVEFGQVLLPSRYPDNTDVLIATCGVWFGLSVTRRFLPRPASPHPTRATAPLAAAPTSRVTIRRIRPTD